MSDSLPGRKGEFVFRDPGMRAKQVRQIKQAEERLWRLEAAEECREGRLDGCGWRDCGCFDIDDEEYEC